MTGDGSHDAVPLLSGKPGVKPGTVWAGRCTDPVVICPLSAALSSFQVFIQGGCVKYYDPSPASPASVASRGRDWLRLHIQVALVT